MLPYKENFSPQYPGAVSLFVFETSKNSDFKNRITVYGSTKLKKRFPIKYVNINLSDFYVCVRNYIYSYPECILIRNIYIYILNTYLSDFLYMLNTYLSDLFYVLNTYL